MPDPEVPSPPNNIPAPTSTLSLTSLMMGIIGWIFLPVVGGLIAIITGHLAKKEIRQSDGLLAGDGLATVGLLLGYANLVLGLCGCLAILLFPALFAGLWAYANQIFNVVP
jgi:uncharacterized protein DUF4190